MADPREIAARLTEAQREFLSRFKDADDLQKSHSGEDELTINELCDLGLVVHIRAVFVFAQITRLGLAVSAALGETK